MSDVLAILTVVFALPLNWWVTWRLWSLSRLRPTNRLLHERAIVAIAVAIVVTVFGLIFLNNDMATPFLDGEATKLITRATVVVVSVVSAAYWLLIYRGARP